jgi:hypothetical protein
LFGIPAPGGRDFGTDALGVFCIRATDECASIESAIGKGAVSDTLTCMTRPTIRTFNRFTLLI